MTRLLSVPRKALLAVSGTVAALAIVAVATAGTSGIPFFGGADAGVHQAASSGAAQPISSSVTHDGITIRVTGFESDDTRTVVGLAVEGRDDLGAGVLPKGQAKIVDQDGQVYQEEAGTADTSNPRLITRYYPPLKASSKTLTLQLNGLQFVELSSGQSASHGVAVDDQWSLQIVPAGAPITSEVVPIENASHAFGSAALVIDKVQQAPSGTVFTGHFTGLSMDEVPELTPNARLIDSSGQSYSIVGMRLGYGTNRELINFRFPRVTGDATLRISLSVDGHVHDAGAAQGLGAALANAGPAEWLLRLPE